MSIKQVSLTNDGYVHCKSNFYSSHDVLDDTNFNFRVGINRLVGEIDSGIWAVSYLLSMYNHQPEDFVLFKQPKAVVNDKLLSIKELSKYTCYMDTLDPLFSSNCSVKTLIIQGLKHNKSNFSYNDIKLLFHIDSERFERPLAGAGNAIFRAMAAIGFSHKKEIYCFPWLSNKRFESYHENLTMLLQILENLGKIVIVPVGPISQSENTGDGSVC